MYMGSNYSIRTAYIINLKMLLTECLLPFVNYCAFVYTLYLKKYVRYSACYNFDIMKPIWVIFGIYATKKVNNQNVKM